MLFLLHTSQSLCTLFETDWVFHSDFFLRRHIKIHGHLTSLDSSRRCSVCEHFANPFDCSKAEPARTLHNAQNHELFWPTLRPRKRFSLPGLESLSGNLFARNKARPSRWCLETLGFIYFDISYQLKNNAHCSYRLSSPQQCAWDTQSVCGVAQKVSNISWFEVLKRQTLPVHDVSPSLAAHSFLTNSIRSTCPNNG